ncbi:hypothetical protein AAFF39_03350 [Lactococcus garvieae]
MNKSEALDYLLDKRKVTAPVAQALNAKNIARRAYDRAFKKWNVRIIVLLVLFFLSISEAESWLLLFLPAAILIGFKLKALIPSKEALDKATAQYDVEVNRSAYIDGRKGFPSQFYNHADCYRLWRLLDEGRAEDLKEAFNLLETQHFYEDQLSTQEEIKSLQKDIANSSRVSAISSTVSAVNSTLINSKLKK